MKEDKKKTTGAKHETLMTVMSKSAVSSLLLAPLLGTMTAYAVPATHYQVDLFPGENKIINYSTVFQSTYEPGAPIMFNQTGCACDVTDNGNGSVTLNVYSGPSVIGTYYPYFAQNQGTETQKNKTLKVNIQSAFAKSVAQQHLLGTTLSLAPTDIFSVMSGHHLDIGSVTVSDISQFSAQYNSGTGNIDIDGLGNLLSSGTVTIVATDPDGTTGLVKTIDLVIDNVKPSVVSGEEPVFLRYNSKILSENQIDMSTLFSDPGDTLSFSVTDTAGLLTSSGNFLTAAKVGTANITVTATDSQGAQNHISFKVAVLPSLAMYYEGGDMFPWNPVITPSDDGTLYIIPSDYGVDRSTPDKAKISFDSIDLPSYWKKAITVHSGIGVKVDGMASGLLHSDNYVAYLVAGGQVSNLTPSFDVKAQFAMPNRDLEVGEEMDLKLRDYFPSNLPITDFTVEVDKADPTVRVTEDGRLQMLGSNKGNATVTVHASGFNTRNLIDGIFQVNISPTVEPPGQTITFMTDLSGTYYIVPEDNTPNESVTASNILAKAEASSGPDGHYLAEFKDISKIHRDSLYNLFVKNNGKMQFVRNLKFDFVEVPKADGHQQLDIGDLVKYINAHPDILTGTQPLTKEALLRMLEGYQSKRTMDGNIHFLF